MNILFYTTELTEKGHKRHKRHKGQSYCPLSLRSLVSLMPLCPFKSPHSKSKISKRSTTLLEVMIAFAIIALCILPLIYPHIFILKSEKKFIAAVELDHLASRLYADRLQKLYQNEIPWQQIVNGEVMPIDATMLQAAGYSGTLPYAGTYRFVKLFQKPRKPVDRSAYLFQLEFTFTEKPELWQEKDLKESNPKTTYKYKIPVEHVEG